MKFKTFLAAIAAIAIASAVLMKPDIIGNLAAQEQFIVAKVVDGDTIRLSSGEKVRFLNIDTPERGQYFWKEATARMKQLAENRTITLEPDRTNRDKYGRLLRYVYVNSTMLNIIMASEGYARSYYIEPDGKHLEEVKEAEAYAKSKNLGIWKYDNITGAFCVWVYELKDDPKGHDEENLNGEYVVFRNSCAHPVGMTGWKIVTARGYSFIFPGFSLDAKAKVWLHSGSGSNNASDIYWGSGKVVWRNSGDTLLAYNAEGQLVLNYSYGKP